MWGNVMVEVTAPLPVVVHYVWPNVRSDWLLVVRGGCYLKVVRVICLSIDETLLVIRMKLYIP